MRLSVRGSVGTVQTSHLSVHLVAHLTASLTWIRLVARLNRPVCAFTCIGTNAGFARNPEVRRRKSEVKLEPRGARTMQGETWIRCSALASVRRGAPVPWGIPLEGQPKGLGCPYGPGSLESHVSPCIARVSRGLFWAEWGGTFSLSQPPPAHRISAFLHRSAHIRSRAKGVTRVRPACCVCTERESQGDRRWITV